MRNVSRCTSRRIRVELWHNLLWSRYKGAVFNALQSRVDGRDDICFSVVHLAETIAERKMISAADRSFHRYQLEVLLKGALDDYTDFERCSRVFFRAMRTSADVVVLPGFDRLEYWVLLLVFVVRRVPRAIFIDSTLDDRPRHLFKMVLKRFFAARVDLVFCYGERAAQYALSLGVPRANLVVRCQAAVMEPTYCPVETAKARRARSDLPTTAVRLLYVGRLAREKGVDLIISALSILKDSDARFVLTIVGDGPDRDELRERASLLGLDGVVVFLGASTGVKLASIFLGNDLLILPSRSEAWGLVVNESLAYGMPVVVSDVCGCIPELVIEGVTGECFRSENVASLVEAIRRASVWATGPSVSERCMKQVARFTPEHAADQIIDGLTRRYVMNAVIGI